ncbi:Sterigmatocystin 8-O-methyltransferase [Leucoagaricus sp. SymC.cos]|nr:Sterigmatocystin 8-O-methyltransferase [Leucoagaricus sp. SymC.cos]
MNHIPPSTSSLVTLIASATSSLESYYNAHPTKPYVPSLDDTEPHPLDTEFYPSDVRQAAQILEGACAQLCATLLRPNHTILNIYQTAFLSVVLRAGVADILLNEPAGLPISEISKRCKIEERRLARILRTLCSLHIFHEVSKDVFSNNRLSMLLLHSNPLASLGWHISDEPTSRSAVHLADTLLDQEWGHSDAPERAAFNRAYESPLPIWHYFEGKDNPNAAEQGTRFGRGMVGWTVTADADAIVTDYPWDKLRQGAIVSDVGGGWGYISMQLYKRYRHLNLKLQDLPEQTAHAQKVIWPKECPQAIADGRIEFKSADIFVESPIPNCDIYLLKNVIHLLPDNMAITALSGIRKVMSPTSRVLVQDYLLQSATRTTDNGKLIREQAQPPLLPNYGVGRIRQYYTDAAMMVLCNSEERSLEHFVQLGRKSGLEFVKVWDLGELNVIEFAPGAFEE